MSARQAAPEPAEEKKSTTHQVVELVVIVAIALGVAFLVQAFLVKPYKIPSGSMEPTLDIGQRVLVNRLAADFGEPAVGDILVFHPPAGIEENGQDQCGRIHPADQSCSVPRDGQSSNTFIKRLVGLPGDTLRIVDGHVIRNGKRESDDYIAPCDGQPQCDLPAPIKVLPGHYFLMGDNRGNSDDSRFWGPIAKDAIIGEAFATYWPPDRIGLE